ncbi:hypothetical protein EDD76_103172 [Kineothrix alysoides]|uniref:Uncharacterized protein n=1 Tax=Kineothrix alysoides TaxID=1469948 RepID=A0A4R1R3G8_9FIRM|nr:hypothetical protein EDD76_103172 [Kineothrix alysoides]
MEQWQNGNGKMCIVCYRYIDNQPHEAIGKNKKHMHYVHRSCLRGNNYPPIKTYNVSN